MSRDVLIRTPENIAIEYELAGLGARFTANIADTALQIMALGAIVVAAYLSWIGLTLLAAARGWIRLASALDQIGEYVLAATIITAFVVFWGYYLYFEYKWNGQTPGKRMIGIRVIREGGYPVDMFSVTVRTFLRLLDFLPAVYFIGIASIMSTRSYQRLGDLLAGTIVVKQRAPRNLINLLQATRLRPEDLDRSALALVLQEAHRLTPDQYMAVRHFTERRRELTSWVAQQEAARVLAVPLMQKLHIVPPTGVQSINYADVLEYLAVAYEEARRPKDSGAPVTILQQVSTGTTAADSPVTANSVS